jgi:hypothetical protein
LKNLAMVWGKPHWIFEVKGREKRKVMGMLVVDLVVISAS